MKSFVYPYREDQEQTDTEVGEVPTLRYIDAVIVLKHATRCGLMVAHHTLKANGFNPDNSLTATELGTLIAGWSK